MAMRDPIWNPDLTSPVLNVVLLIRSLNLGGAEIQLSLLARELAKRGHQVHVVTLYGGGVLAGELASSGIPVHAIDKRGRWDLVAPWFRLLRLVRSLGPSCILSYMDIANIAALSLKPFLNGAMIVWGVRATAVKLEFSDLNYHLLLKIERSLERFVDGVICNSQAAAFDRPTFAAKRVRVVENGIDCEKFQPLKGEGERAALRAKLGIAKDEFVVGIVGRLDPVKDIATFLRAAKLTRDLQAPARFLIVGDGSQTYKASLVELSRSLGIEPFVTWTGAWQGSMASCYGCLDVLVSSSVGEGFSNVVAEAMACGVGCVVTDVGDSARIVGELGEVVAVGDFTAMGHAIRKVLAELSPELAVRRRQSIADRFGLERLASDTEIALDHFAALRGVRG
jgi:glycosyltransferase involved in cell wall biosynthesis